MHYLYKPYTPPREVVDEAPPPRHGAAVREAHHLPPQPVPTACRRTSRPSACSRPPTYSAGWGYSTQAARTPTPGGACRPSRRARRSTGAARRAGRSAPSPTRGAGRFRAVHELHVGAVPGVRAETQRRHRAVLEPRVVLRDGRGGVPMVRACVSGGVGDWDGLTWLSASSTVLVGSAAPERGRRARRGGAGGGAWSVAGGTTRATGVNIARQHAPSSLDVAVASWTSATIRGPWAHRRHPHTARARPAGSPLAKECARGCSATPATLARWASRALEP